MANEQAIAAEVAAAADLLRDFEGDGAAVVEKLTADFGISTATAWRRVRAARESLPAEADSPPPGGDDRTDYAVIALAALAASVRAAEAEGDFAAVADRAAALAGAVAKLRTRWA